MVLSMELGINEYPGNCNIETNRERKGELKVSEGETEK